MKENNLIFIVSQPRAGSTFLQNILSNNSQVNTTSEHWLLLNFANQIKPELITGAFDNELSNDAIQTLKNEIGEEWYNEKFRKFLLSLYFPLLGKNDYVIDKTPRYWEILEEIKLIFPQSKIIILKRNPIAVLKSIINTWQIDTLEKLEYYKRDLMIAPKALQDFSSKFSNDKNVKTVVYEDFLTDIRKHSSALYSWLEIPFDNNHLNLEDNIKILGKYGDPFQNAIDNYAITKLRAKDIIKDSSVLKNVINEYASFLGIDFLENYGGYKHEVNLKRNFNYKDFFYKPHSNKDVQRELNNIKNSKTYKMMNSILIPYRFIKRVLVR